MLIESFAPVVPPDPAVLVLGSMPGIRSLQAGEYYAHPRNRFWTVMRDVAGGDPDATYQARLDRLGRAGIALWDVLKHCRREGSLDSAIRRSSEIPNEIGRMLEDHASIRLVALNGAKAAGAFRRRVLPGLGEAVLARVEILELPSTSPANASWSRARLVGAWSAIGPYIRGDPRDSPSA